MSPISELERTLFGLGGFGRRLVPLFREGTFPEPSEGAPFRFNVWDSGADVVIYADVPGLSEKDVQISFTRDTLTVSGQRPSDTPEGYTALRRERQPVRFDQSIRFRVPVDVEKITAVVQNGRLTITLPREAQPTVRTIPVQASIH
jgi:HSP20 family protein